MTDTDTYADREDILVPIGTAAQMLGVSVPTIRRWHEAGRITATRTLGGQRRFSLAEVDRVKTGAAA